MRIYGINAQCGQNLFPKNSRKNEVSFGKIDNEIKDEVYKMAERSPYIESNFRSNSAVINYLDVNTQVLIYKNHSNGKINCKPIIPKDPNCAKLFNWFNSDNGRKYCSNINMENLAKIADKMCDIEEAEEDFDYYKTHISMDEAKRLDDVCNSDS